jgi:phosphoenolpyruvate carboxykinase (GTP)
MSPTPLEAWVDQAASLTQPDSVRWCEGSDAEYNSLVTEMVRGGGLLPLNQKAFPGSYLHRSNPNDVARTEHLTYICTPSESDAGPSNNWLLPEKAKEMATPILRGAMRGRTMYVLPYLMGPAGSPLARVGVEVTDSPYVAVSMRIMTRMGSAALNHLGNSPNFAPGLHCLGDLSPDRRLILHFPEEQLVWSVGSGYGGNALLGKKCLALRLSSWLARRNGWLAEHMLILGLESPGGEITYMAAAFPSACGKTNLAMLISPLASMGYRVWTVGDDIAWMRIGSDGRLWAMNPENGFFGVAPGTSRRTNPNMMEAARSNSIYTNVAITSDGEPWWEGMDGAFPLNLTDWKGNQYTPASGESAAHPNARLTVPTRQCPSISPSWEDPRGVPISAIIFGGRRARVAPLVYQSLSWQHGVFVGATMASETTAAATGKVGVVRRDPMAMLPFCGYHMGDYFAHWLAMGSHLSNPPKIFHVNWFRKGEDGRFLWPGFGENVRVLAWILDQVRDRVQAQETPIGLVPRPADLISDGLKLAPGVVEELLNVDGEAWRAEAEEQADFLRIFGMEVPAELWKEHGDLVKRLG